MKKVGFAILLAVVLMFSASTAVFAGDHTDPHVIIVTPGTGVETSK